VTRRFLGIDVGGTSCKLAVLEVDGDRADSPGPSGDHPGGPPNPPKLLATAMVPTGPGGPDEVLDRLAAEGTRLATEHGPVVAAGAGVPGLFDEDSGRIVFLPNLPAAWNGRELGRPLVGRLGVTTVLINDARAFTLAESRMGAAAGCSTVVCLTLGTGVGGGVVVDGRLRYGPHGRAGEVGHQVIDPNGPRCGCGNRGCVEAFAAGAALSRLGGRDSPQAVFRAAEAGDELAAAAVQAVAWRLAAGIANLVTVLWPERVVVGGGIAAAGERLLGPLRAAVADATPLVDQASYEIVPAALGPTAGAIGAALWAEERAGGSGGLKPSPPEGGG
jgi:glucokinase